MVKNGGKVKWERLCSFLAVYLGVFKTLSQAGTAMWRIISESPGHVLSLEKNPASPSWGNCIWNCWIYGRPAGFFTKMLRFDKKFQRNFSAISLQLLKLLSIIKREILEKNVRPFSIRSNHCGPWQLALSTCLCQRDKVTMRVKTQDMLFST
jgi:hypothetical protein